MSHLIRVAALAYACAIFLAGYLAVATVLAVYAENEQLSRIAALEHTLNDITPAAGGE